MTTETKKRQIIDFELALEMLNKLKKGWTLDQLSNLYNLKRAYIGRILANKFPDEYRDVTCKREKRNITQHSIECPQCLEKMIIRVVEPAAKQKRSTVFGFCDKCAYLGGLSDLERGGIKIDG